MLIDIKWLIFRKMVTQSLVNRKARLFLGSQLAVKLLQVRNLYSK